MKSACQKMLFKGVNTPNGGPSISHMFYANDGIFVGDCSNSNFVNLSLILRCFHATFGLKVNLRNSNVFGIGVSDKVILVPRLLSAM